MCFDTCVSMDPATGTKHIPPSARVDPSALRFHPLPPSTSPTSPSNDGVAVTLFHLGSLFGYRQVFADDTWDTNLERRKKKANEPVELPIMSALIEHHATGEKWLWDLGMTNDSSILPSMFSDGTVNLFRTDLADNDQLKNVLLRKFNVNTVEEIGLTGIILSHAHLDHYGNLLDFPTSIPVYVGPGTMDWIGGGEDAAKRGEKGLISFPTSFLKDRSFVEMDKVKENAEGKVTERVKEVKVGPFEKAWDWFGDGSMIVAFAEGHCPGHLVLLAQTSSSPPSYVLLSGDAAHQQALYHPLPPPLELSRESLVSSAPYEYGKTYSQEEDLRAAPSFFDPSSSGAVTDKYIPDDKAICMQDFPDKAMRTLAALTRMESCVDVMVVLAHEIEFVKAVGLERGQEILLNDWHEKWIKERKIELGRRERERLAAL